MEEFGCLRVEIGRATDDELGCTLLYVWSTYEVVEMKLCTEYYVVTPYVLHGMHDMSDDKSQYPRDGENIEGEQSGRR